jgi:hypothetical protein
MQRSENPNIWLCVLQVPDLKVCRRFPLVLSSVQNGPRSSSELVGSDSILEILKYKILVFWVVTQCSILVWCWSFGEIFWFYLELWKGTEMGQRRVDAACLPANPFIIYIINVFPVPGDAWTAFSNSETCRNDLPSVLCNTAYIVRNMFWPFSRAFMSI